MRLVFFILFFSLAGQILHGVVGIQELQDRINDSSGSELVRLNLEIAELYLREDLKMARYHASIAEEMALELNLKYESGVARKILGNVYFLKNEFHQALSIYESALSEAYSSGDNELIGDLYFNIGNSLKKKNDFDAALENLKKSLIYRELLESKTQKLISFNSIGLLYWEQQKYQKSVFYFQLAEEIIDPELNPRLAAATLNNLGNALVKSGDSVMAAESYIRSLRLRENFGSLNELANANLNLGNLYFTTGNSAEAINYYYEAIRLYNETGNLQKSGIAMSNLGSAYNELNMTNAALANHLSAIELFEKENMKSNISKSLNNIGNIYFKHEDYESAYEYYNRAKIIKYDKNDIEGLAITYSNISQAQLSLGLTEKALINAYTSIEYSQVVDDRNTVLKNLHTIAQAYEYQNELEKSITYYKKYINLDQDLYAAANREVFAEMMVRFESEEKSREIYELRLIQRLQEEKMYQEKKAKTILSILLLVIGFATFTLALMYILKQKEVKKRKKVQVELEELNRNLENRIEKALEEYRVNQQIIAQKSKMESLGKMAAGIAHEINQPLSAISLSIDNIMYKNQKDMITKDYLKKKCDFTQQDILRIREIIEHVRLFSRDQKNTVIEEVDINLVVKNALKLTEHLLKKSKISPRLDLSDEKVVIMGNKFKLEQVLVNLISNSRDAIDEKNCSKDIDFIREIRIKTGIYGDVALIEIYDTGIGISDEIAEKIFDPFFTTKSSDKGTGLGLSISYGIIQEMEGEIDVDSRKGESTRLTIKFPFIKEMK